MVRTPSGSSFDAVALPRPQIVVIGDFVPARDRQAMFYLKRVMLYGFEFRGLE